MTVPLFVIVVGLALVLAAGPLASLRWAYTTADVAADDAAVLVVRMAGVLVALVGLALYLEGG